MLDFFLKKIAALKTIAAPIYVSHSIVYNPDSSSKLSMKSNLLPWRQPMKIEGFLICSTYWAKNCVSII